MTLKTKRRSEMLSSFESMQIFRDEPEKIAFSIPDVRHLLGLSWKEILDEFGSGRLVVHGKRTGPMSYEEMSITGRSLLDWFAHPKTPVYLLMHALQSMKTAGERPREKDPEVIRMGDYL